MSANVIWFRGDDTSANGNQAITIEIENEELHPFSKLVFVVNEGQIFKEFTDPNNFAIASMELIVNFTSAETWKMRDFNVGHLVTYDMNNKQSTCNEVCNWCTKNGVIKNVGCSC